MNNNSKLSYINSLITNSKSNSEILELKFYGVMRAFDLGYPIEDALSFFGIDRSEILNNIDNLSTVILADSESLDLLDDEEAREIASTIKREREDLVNRLKKEFT